MSFFVVSVKVSDIDEKLVSKSPNREEPKNEFEKSDRKLSLRNFASKASTFSDV